LGLTTPISSSLSNMVPQSRWLCNSSSQPAKLRTVLTVVP